MITNCCLRRRPNGRGMSARQCGTPESWSWLSAAWLRVRAQPCLVRTGSRSQSKKRVMRIFSKILPIFAALAFTPPALAAGHEAAPETVAGAPSYVRFPAIFVPIIEGDRVSRQIGVGLTLELAQGQEKQP